MTALHQPLQTDPLEASGVVTQLMRFPPLDRVQPAAPDESSTTAYMELVQQCKQFARHVRATQEKVAETPCETEFARRASKCFARAAASLSDFFYLASKEVARVPNRNKMLVDAFEELGALYEDIAESHALASSVRFADWVERELATVATESA